MYKVSVGTVVYAKKHSTFFRDTTETPHIVKDTHKNKYGNIVAVLETGDSVSFGELTDVPCSTMVCGECKWHKKPLDKQKEL